MLDNNEPILSKWYQFLKKLQNSGLYREFGDTLDLHPYNFGIDKEGNIKLIDF